MFRSIIYFRWYLQDLHKQDNWHYNNKGKLCFKLTLKLNTLLLIELILNIKLIFNNILLSIIFHIIKFKAFEWSSKVKLNMMKNRWKNILFVLFVQLKWMTCNNTNAQIRSWSLLGALWRKIMRSKCTIVDVLKTSCFSCPILFVHLMF